MHDYFLIRCVRGQGQASGLYPHPVTLAEYFVYILLYPAKLVYILRFPSYGYYNN